MWGLSQGLNAGSLTPLPASHRHVMVLKDEERFKTVVLNLRVVTLPGSADPFTGVTVQIRYPAYQTIHHSSKITAMK